MKIENPICTVGVIEMSGNETDAQCKEIAWEMFCQAHPFEANQHDPEAFWKYFHEQFPTISREQMLALLKESEE